MSCEDPNRDRTIPAKVYKPKWCNPICKRPKDIVVDKMFMKICKKDPPHPCDVIDCDPKDRPEGGQCKPALCRHRIKNYSDPYYLRCKSGYKFPVENCKEDPPHPCDPPLPCVSGPSPQMKCVVPLCKQRVKNLEKNWIRCPGPEDQLEPDLCRNREIFKKQPTPCKRGKCYKPPAIKPDPPPPCCPKPEPSVAKKKELEPWYYSKPICDNWNLFFKTKIPDCKRGKCEKPPTTTPDPPPPCCADLKKEEDAKRK